MERRTNIETEEEAPLLMGCCGTLPRWRQDIRREIVYLRCPECDVGAATTVFEGDEDLEHLRNIWNDYIEDRRIRSGRV